MRENEVGGEKIQGRRKEKRKDKEREDEREVNEERRG